MAGLCEQLIEVTDMTIYIQASSLIRNPNSVLDSFIKNDNWAICLIINNIKYPINYIYQLNEELAEKAFSFDDEGVGVLLDEKEVLYCCRERTGEECIHIDIPQEWEDLYLPKITPYLKEVIELWNKEFPI